MSETIIQVHEVPCQALVIRADGFGNITAFLQDFGGGRGRLTVEHDGDSWSYYWGAMGDRTLREFLASTSRDYLSGKLIGAAKLSTFKRRIVERIADVLTRAMAVDP